MEHIINKIIEIEMKAQSLIKNAKQEQSEITAKANAVIEKHHHEYLEKAHKRINRIKAEETAFANKRIAEMQKKHAQKLDKIEKLEARHISEWVEEVYNYVISPTVINAAQNKTV